MMNLSWKGNERDIRQNIKESYENDAHSGLCALYPENRFLALQKVS